jgi:cytochrome c biogenesis protein CcdA
VQPTHQRIRLSDISIYLGYAVSAVVFVFGAVIATGLLIDVRFPPQFRVMFGIVFMLMGIYRFVLTRTKIRQWQAEDENEDS